MIQVPSRVATVERALGPALAGAGVLGGLALPWADGQDGDQRSGFAAVADRPVAVAAGLVLVLAVAAAGAAASRSVRLCLSATLAAGGALAVLAWTIRAHAARYFGQLRQPDGTWQFAEWEVRDQPGAGFYVTVVIVVVPLAIAMIDRLRKRLPGRAAE